MASKSVDYPQEPFHVHILRDIWSHHLENPRRAAFIDAENESDFITYGELHQTVYKIANYLNKNGIKKGDIGSIVLPNSWHYAAFFLGMAAVGGATSGVSPMGTEYELNRQISDSKTSVILTEKEHLRTVQAAIRNLSHVKIIIVIDSKDNDTFGQNVKHWKEVISCEPIFDLNSVHFDLENDLIALPYSSGTTGVPKGVMITHKNYNYLLAAMQQHNVDYIYPYIYPGVDFRKEYGLAFLPFYHAYGFYMLSGSMSRGVTELIMKRFNFELALKLVSKYKIKGLGSVPAIMVLLAKSPLVDKYDLSSLRALSSGGAPLSKSLCDEVMKRFPNVISVIQGYGMTEMTCASHAAKLDGEHCFGSVGQVIPGTEYKIANLSDGSMCKPGEKGELWVRGPQIMKGYLGKPKETAEAVDKDGWLHTGDVVYEDDNKNLFICDRIKELIKVSAYQVPPAELEGIILTHPNVADASVIGIPDRKHGELPRAYVVLKKKDGNLQEIVDFVKGKVSHYKQLKGGIESVDVLPRTPAGKVMRRVLKDNYLKKYVNKSKL
uniref:4-coumarate--CoA ligase 1-like n=1 Tax=Steinernema glaseri TaxID=37863 RepID=A0A1I8AD01_9BILA